MMNRPFTILLADRNPRIRDFIQRELNSEGHRVVTAENCEQLRQWLDKPIQLDALVLDPNLPGLDAPSIDGKDQLIFLFAKRPDLPIVFHCLASDCSVTSSQMKQTAYIEKNGDSVDNLKKQLRLILKTNAIA